MRAQSYPDHGSSTQLTKHLKPIREAFYRAKANTCGAGGGETVAQAFRDVAHPRTAIERQHLQSSRSGGHSIAVEREEVCGDAWEVIETAGSLRAMVVDGLGHGPFAGEAAREAQGKKAEMQSTLKDKSKTHLEMLPQSPALQQLKIQRRIYGNKSRSSNNEGGADS